MKQQAWGSWQDLLNHCRFLSFNSEHQKKNISATAFPLILPSLQKEAYFTSETSLYKWADVLLSWANLYKWAGVLLLSWANLYKWAGVLLLSWANLYKWADVLLLSWANLYKLTCGFFLLSFRTILGQVLNLVSCKS